ncbi:unnamed protein product, partial [Staurois parvus]
MSLFHILKFPASSVPHMSLRRREWNPEDGCWHWPEDIAEEHCRGHCRRDIAGAKDNVSEEEILEQHCKVFPSVARGYRLW